MDIRPISLAPHPGDLPPSGCSSVIEKAYGILHPYARLPSWRERAM